MWEHLKQNDNILVKEQALFKNILSIIKVISGWVVWKTVIRTGWERIWEDFTIMLPCIVIDLFLNNQPDALIIQILFCYKTPHVSGIFCAHLQEFYTVYSALVNIMQVSDDRFQAESGWNCSSILTLLGSGHQTCMILTSAKCTVENSW
jgi:hypothetical protein